MPTYQFDPFETLAAGDFFGAIYETWALILGESVIFQIAFAVICGLVWIKTKNVIAAGLTGVFISLPMIAHPDAVTYLGAEGQLIAVVLLIVSVMVILARIAISIYNK